MSVSNHEVELETQYEGFTTLQSERAHTWVARWDLPDGDSLNAWRQHLLHALNSDRILEPVPEGAWFNADLEARTLVVTAMLAEAGAPSDPVERDAIGHEVVGLVQGLIFDS